MVKQYLLLLDDVCGLGRSGDVVTAKPGYIRNFLLPQQKALIADKNTLKLQARLQEERAKKAALDKKLAEELAVILAQDLFVTSVKADPDGKMYGSVTVLDVLRIIKEKGYQIERRQIELVRPIKKVGKHSISLKLNEGVVAKILLEIRPEHGALPVEEAVVEEKEEESNDQSTQE